jgi:hypothetical protein
MSSDLAIRAFQGAATRRDDRLAIAAIGGVGLVDQAAAAGSPTISSSRKGASVSSVMELARRSANSSFHSSGMAPMSRTMASNYGIA